MRDYFGVNCSLNLGGIVSVGVIVSLPCRVHVHGVCLAFYNRHTKYASFMSVSEGVNACGLSSPVQGDDRMFMWLVCVCVGGCYSVLCGLWAWVVITGLSCQELTALQSDTTTTNRSAADAIRLIETCLSLPLTLICMHTYIFNSLIHDSSHVNRW